MKLNHAICATLIGASGAVLAAVSADEAKQLGTTLTEFGAVKAGNADGTIPPYGGGVTKAPAGFKPGSGFWVDPFKDDKPLFRIGRRGESDLRLVGGDISREHAEIEHDGAGRYLLRDRGSRWRRAAPFEGA